MNALSDPQIIQDRQQALSEPHIKPLNQAVDKILRSNSNLAWRIPTFDPHDGGVDAEVLFVLEAPGPQSVITGFISRDNPDATARNWIKLSQEARLDRKRTAMWNICPQYICNKKGNVRRPSSSEIQTGYSFIKEHIIPKMNKIKLVVMVGESSRKCREQFKKDFPSLELDQCPHPSQMFINRNRHVNYETVRTSLIRFRHLIGD